MARPRGRIFNFFKHLEDRGFDFDKPKERREYPKALYHPRGETFVEQPGKRVSAPWAPGGYEIVGRIEHTIQRIANNAEEEAALLKEGWHKTAAEAKAAREAAPVREAAKPARTGAAA